MVVVNASQPRLGNQCVFEQMGLSIAGGWEQIGRTVEAGWVCSPVSRNCDGATVNFLAVPQKEASAFHFIGAKQAHTCQRSCSSRTGWWWRAGGGRGLLCPAKCHAF